MSGLAGRVRLTAPIVLIMAVGVVCAGYLLVKQRFPVPFQDQYEVRAVLPAADGVAPGFGQTVSVSGVKVGTITGAKVVGDRAEVVLTIERDRLPAVYRDARVDLRPITPLKDMEISIVPGEPSAGRLPEGEPLGVARTTAPVPLSDLLSTLDVDTRTFLTGLLGSVDQGLDGRAPDLRRILRALGPTADEMGKITRSLDGRRRELARLVRNVTAVTKAAAADGRLADVVVTGDRTVQALAAQDRPLGRSLEQLPATLRSADDALRTVGTLSDELVPALTDLTPPVRRLPATLRSVRPTAADFSRLLRRDFRPLVRTARPVASDLGPAIDGTTKVLPDLTRVLQGTRHLTNELGYNPPGEDEGYLRWLSWMGHNLNSMSSTADAHGAISRALPILSCPQTVQALDVQPIISVLTGTAGSGVCPNEDRAVAAAARKTENEGR